MENQHQKINSYRELTQEDIDLMNEIKTHAERTRELVEKVALIERDRPRRVMDFQGHSAAALAGQEAHEANRWISIGRTSLQQGFMALTRAVAKPGTF